MTLSRRANSKRSGSNKFGLERATRFELATASLEGWSSTPELRPPFLLLVPTTRIPPSRPPDALPMEDVPFGGEARIRTLEADGNRFTVCPLCPLGYLPIERRIPSGTSFKE